MSETATRVRVATHEDEAEIMDICRKVWSEIGMFPMSEDKVKRTIRMALDGEWGVIGVIGEPGKIEGSICLIVGDTWYSDELIIQERWNFVLPEYRKSDNSVQLIEFARKAADDLNLRLTIGIVSNERTEAKIRHYRRHIGTPIGAVFMYDGAAQRMM